MEVWVILACIAVMLVTGGLRGRGGVALADVATLVALFLAIFVVDLVLRQFVDTGDYGWTLAMLLSAGLAIDYFYGWMAPERQRRRNAKVRAIINRRGHA